MHNTIKATRVKNSRGSLQRTNEYYQRFNAMGRVLAQANADPEVSKGPSRTWQF